MVLKFLERRFYKMQVVSKGIVNGKILDKFGKRSNIKKFGMPTYSLPIQIKDAPKGTKSFAIIFDDPGSVKVCRYVWIHWLVCNLTRTNLEEDESLNSFDFVQGKNSWNENCYGGPCPPDRPHNYRLRVFALNDKLNLRGDFLINQLEEQMKGKILAECEIFGVYDN